MILEYILLTSILSIVGYLAYNYLLVRYLSPSDRKKYLHALVCLSLALPLFIVNLVPDFQFEQATHSHNIFLEDASTNLDAEISICYEKASSETDFCDCQNLAEDNLILYKEDKVYNSLIPVLGYLVPLIFLLGFIILIILVVKINTLRRVIKTSTIKERTINGNTYYILYNSKSEFPAASFRLLRQYIIWNPALNRLSPQEQEAILMHEIAHLENRDTWELITLHLLQIFWLFNPVYYKLKQEIALLNEFLADDFAIQRIGDRLIYAGLLIKIKEQQNSSLAVSIGSSDLSKRIKEILEPTSTQLSSTVPVTLSLVLMLSVTGLLSALPIHQQEQAIQQYEYIQKQYHQTGKDYFCKTCLYDDLNAECN